MMRLLLVYIIMGLFACEVGYGQDFKQALLDMQEAMRDARQLHVVMDISVFKNNTEKAPFYHDKAEVNRDGDNYLYHYSNNDFLLNERVIIIVDKGQKEIVYKKRNDKAKTDLSKKMNFSIDSILTLYENPQHIARENGIDQFRVVQKKGVVTNIDLYVNSETHLLQKMLYEYKNGERVVINFDVFDTHAVFGASDFDDKHYVQTIKGKVSGVGNYKGYKVSTE